MVPSAVGAKTSPYCGVIKEVSSVITRHFKLFQIKKARRRFFLRRAFLVVSVLIYITLSAENKDKIAMRRAWRGSAGTCPQ
jgi:hypothetical protein